MLIIGIDPGPVTGMALLWLQSMTPRKIVDTPEALQVTPGALHIVLSGLVEHMPVIAIERFVVSSRAGRSATARAGEAARDVIGIVTDWAKRYELVFATRSAADVKPWATDERLKAAGLLEVTHGMRHARDAARHALFCAVSRYGLPDPLSRRAR